MSNLCVSSHSERHAAKRAVSGYGEWVEGRIAEGCTAYLLTFMFNPLPASSQTERITLMHADIEAFYGRLARRFANHPKKPSQRAMLPTLIASPDLPVFKHQKGGLIDVAVNDGLHVHGVLLRPAVSRFEGRLEAWLYENDIRLMRDTRLRFIHIVKIDRTPGSATRYALKALGARIEMDSLLVLPLSASERLDATARGYDEAVNTEGGATMFSRGSQRWS